MASRELVVIEETPGLSDLTALRFEVSCLRDQLTDVTGQMALERELAGTVHETRYQQITESPELGQIFGVEGEPDEDATGYEKTGPRPGTEDVLSAAFMEEPDAATMRAEIDSIQALIRQLWKEAHPDAGNDSSTASSIGGSLNLARTGDASYSVGTALLALSSESASVDDIQKLRDDRYRLNLALSNSVTRFDTSEEAEVRAGREIEGAAWRTRVEAGFVCLDLITGGPEVLNDYLADLAQKPHVRTIDMINSHLPKILAIAERIKKGEPIKLDTEVAWEVDAVLGRIWDKLSKDESSLIPYDPPYLMWLEVLAPALEALDPGEIPGQEYTHFGPIFQSRSQATDTDYFGGLLKGFDDMKHFDDDHNKENVGPDDLFSEKNYYNNSNSNW